MGQEMGQQPHFTGPLHGWGPDASMDLRPVLDRV